MKHNKQRVMKGTCAKKKYVLITGEFYVRRMQDKWTFRVRPVLFLLPILEDLTECCIHYTKQDFLCYYTGKRNPYCFLFLLVNWMS